VLVTGDLVPEALEVAEARARHQGARWLRLGEEYRVLDLDRADGWWSFDLEGAFATYEGISLRLRGRHQVTNFATAVAAVEGLFDRGLDEAGVREAAATATSPGRMELVSQAPLILTDGAHNPDGMAALAVALREEFPDTGWTAVLGAMIDKDVAAMLGHLDGTITEAHTAAADSARARGAEEMADLVRQHLDIPASPHASVAAAVAAAMATGDPVLITGSIYVVAEARRALGLA
jgi:dihydrofolate synthase/folylpolyglutamate synthase